MNLPLGRSQVTRALAVACGALTLVIALELAIPNSTGDSGKRVEATDVTLPPLGDLPPYVAPTFESFAEVLERPLFYEDRRLPPPPEVAQAAEAPAEPLLLTLEGIAISGDSRVALLRDTRSNSLVQVAEGASHNGWTLQSVEGGTAVFKRGDDITELGIEVTTGPGAPDRRRPR
ncbi:MAG: hypothetical protein OEW35_06865 [Gammaproteobacteria bacterium]|nr:hypothetical protein [Gammaproteobacteria bacterium]MDH4253160.1 hypothetical protein [Gammaproteobacteria bacterium]MDH5308478.1 hypothetical protein [Gammaproteobacteria bacterium]